MSGTYEFRMDRKRNSFYLRLHLVKGIVGRNAEDYGEVRFGEEGLEVVYHGDNHVGTGEKILRYITNK